MRTRRGRPRDPAGVPAGLRDRHPGPDERAYGEEDVEDARRGKVLRESGLDDEDLLGVEQLLGLGLARYAEAFRLAFAKAFIRPGDTEVDVARRYAAAFEGIRPLAEPHLGHVLFLHLRQLVRSDVLSAEERRTGRPSGREQTAVAFADLVGFTALGEAVGEEELGGVAGRLTIGSTVNLASRLAGRARPGSVLAAGEVRGAAADAFEWSAAGEKRLKGFASPVRAHRARRRPAGPEQAPGGRLETADVVAIVGIALRGAAAPPGDEGPHAADDEHDEDDRHEDDPEADPPAVFSGGLGDRQHADQRGHGPPVPRVSDPDA